MTPDHVTPDQVTLIRRRDDVEPTWTDGALADALAPGGRYLIDTFIADTVLAKFEPMFSGDHHVAVWAHVGGFLTGVLLVKVFENRHLVVRRSPTR